MPNAASGWPKRQPEALRFRINVLLSHTADMRTKANCTTVADRSDIQQSPPLILSPVRRRSDLTPAIRPLQ